MKAVFFALLFEQSIGTNGGLDDIMALFSSGGSEDELLKSLLPQLVGSNAGGSEEKLLKSLFGGGGSESKVLDLGAMFGPPTTISSSSNDPVQMLLDHLLGGSPPKSDHVSIPGDDAYSKYIKASDPHAIHWNLNHPAARGGIYMNRDKAMDGWEWRDVFHVHAKDGDESWLEDNGLGKLKDKDITSGVREAVHYSKVFRKFLEGEYLKNNGRLNRLLNTSTVLQDCLDRIWINGPNEDCHIKNDDFIWWQKNLLKGDGGETTLIEEYDIGPQTQNTDDPQLFNPGNADTLNEVIEDLKELQEQLGYARQEKALNRLPYAIADDTSGKYPFIDPFLYPDKQLYDRDPFTGEIHLKPTQEDSGEENILSRILPLLLNQENEKSSGGDDLLMSIRSLFGGGGEQKSSGGDDLMMSLRSMFGGGGDQDDADDYYDDYYSDYYDDHDGDYYYDGDDDGYYYDYDDDHDHHEDHHHHYDYTFDPWH